MEQNQEGLTKDGKLKKGYRFAKGGKVVKVNASKTDEQKQLESLIKKDKKELKELKALEKKGERRYNGTGLKGQIESAEYRIDFNTKKLEDLKVN